MLTPRSPATPWWPTATAMGSAEDRTHAPPLTQAAMARPMASASGLGQSKPWGFNATATGLLTEGVPFDPFE